jgi:hypothetical protein
MGERDARELEAALARIKFQAQSGNLRVTQHAQQEMVEEQISIEKCTIQGCPGEYESRSIVSYPQRSPLELESLDVADRTRVRVSKDGKGEPNRDQQPCFLPL